MDKFLDTYQRLTADSLYLLSEIYTKDVRFIDPAHEINGLDPLKAYFANLYRNINAPGFRFTQHLRSADEGYVQWEMDFSHPRLNRGRLITVPGASYLIFSDENRVSLHRDYFDLGAMLYEQLPAFGRVITAIKRRLGS
jgi:hypothetical protein